MASTFSNLKIQLMATGENSGTWGNTTNVNLGTAIEQALVETATVTFASGNVTLTLTDTNAAQNARALRLNLTGTTGGARDLIVPAIQKPYIVNNGTADIITVKVTGQTGIAVPASTSMLLYNNGTDVVVAFNRVVGNVVGNLTGNVTGNVTGTASNATVLQTARNIQISGGATAANVSFNGSAAVNLNVTAINVGTATAGTLPEARGGTGETSYTNGQLLIGSTPDGGLVKSTLTAGTGITITNGAGSITVAASGAGGFSGSQGFNSPGTFTAPPTTNRVLVILQAGGGGGGGANVGKISSGIGGGGGGAAMGVVTVTGGSPFSVTVGAGGSAGIGSQSNNTASNAGGSGGASSFSNLISANGGGGGAGAPTSGASSPSTTAGGTGTSPTGVGITGGSGIGQDGGNSAFGAGGGLRSFIALDAPINVEGDVDVAGGGGLGGNSANFPAPNGKAGAAGFVFVAF